MSRLTPDQLAALTALRGALGNARWSLIGASALHCQIALPRKTEDVDVLVNDSETEIAARLTQHGWTRHPQKRQTWLLENCASADVVPATTEDIESGAVLLDDGVSLSLIGCGLALTEVNDLSIGAATVRVARYPVLALLKMVAWLERPHERSKDLEDLVTLFDGILDDDDSRRWGTDHPVGASGLEHENQSAFFLGYELGVIARAEDLHWIVRFLARHADDESADFAMFLRASRYVVEDRDARLRARLGAFEKGIHAGIASQVRPPPSRAKAAPARDVAQILHDAIEMRRIVQFRARGRLRIAEPHVLGVKNHRVQVLVYQLDGHSSSGRLPDWRRFDCRSMTDLVVTDEGFPGPRWTGRGRHSSFDRHIAIVRP